MRLGVNLAYRDAAQVAARAESLGYACALAAEGHRADAPTVLAWTAAHTEKIGLIGGLFQMPARAPAMTAMTAATLDVLSGGRFSLGLGISNPSVSEGWYGVPFTQPLQRTREYVDVVRMALRRDPVSYRGAHYTLPLPGSAAAPFRLIEAPVRERIPIYLGAIGPRNLELAGEIADGWLAGFFDPEHGQASLASIRTGRARAGKDLDGFEVIASVPLVVGDDPVQAAEPVRHYVARFLGLGGRRGNFYRRLADQMGFAAAAERIGDRFGRGDYAGAVRAVPFEFIDRTSLLGPVPRIAGRMGAYAAAGVTTLAVSLFAPEPAERLAALEAAAFAMGHAGAGV